MTSNPADVQDIVARLGWHHEHPVTGKLVLRNLEGPEAAAEIERLRAALQQSRSAVIEECAKVAESIISADQYDTMDTDCYQDTANRIANAIRALAVPQ